MSKTIPYGKHFIDEDDVNAVVNILENHQLTQGSAVDSFEKAIANYVGAKYAVAMSSWTSGLHMAYHAIGLNNTNSLITSPITFVASSNAAFYCNSKPYFADIDKDTINICHKDIERHIKQSDGTIKAIIPVHYAGLPCKMEEISKISRQYDCFIIEDAAHALGAKYEDGSMVGSCKYSDMTGFSFHPVKSIAAGEGGMITTNSYKIYKRLLRIRSHGINKLDDKFLDTKQAFTGELSNPWYYEMQELGYNFRITDIQCALGESQLKKLPSFLKKRRELAKKYDEAFKDLPHVKPIHSNQREFSSHHLYVLRIEFNKVGISRAKLMHKLKEEGIITQVHYIPVTSHPFYKNLGYKTEEYPESKSFYDEALSIPLFFSLTDKEQNKVIDKLKNLLS